MDGETATSNSITPSVASSKWAFSLTVSGEWLGKHIGDGVASFLVCQITTIISFLFASAV